MILFCKNKTKTIWMCQDALTSWDLCGSDLRLFFSLNGYAKWAELGDACWKGETAGRGARREVWKEIEVGKWKVTELESDFHSYPSVVKEGCDL